MVVCLYKHGADAYDRPVVSKACDFQQLFASLDTGEITYDKYYEMRSLIYSSSRK